MAVTVGVGYVRVSTDRQADEGGGLAVQEAAVRAFARANGIRLRAVVRDEGVSGAADALDRPGLLEVVEQLRDERARVVVVYRLDRLARDMVLQEQLLAEVGRLGGRLHSCSPTEDAYLVDDPTDPTRALVRQVLGVVSQYERAMIRLRMAAGKRRKLEAGGYAHGQPPYGWQAHNGELIEQEHEQAVIARLRRGRAAGQSYRQLADELNDAGVSARRGGWHPQTVARAVIRSGVSGG